MTRAYLAAGLACLLILSVVPAAELDETKLGQIAPRLQKFVDDHVIAGAVAVVGTSREVVYLHAVGDARLEPKKPMTKDALFRIASMTKPITAVGVMILVEEGKLAVDDPVEKHLSEFRGQQRIEKGGKGPAAAKKPARPITVRDLLTHTSGLPGYPARLGNVYAKRDHTLEESVRALAKQPLNFEPGSRWSYCNTGIDTLGRLIEVASGQPYETFLAKRIFQPLGMKDTTFQPTAEQFRRLAALYGTKAGKLVSAPDALIGRGEAVKHPIPAGGLYSTGADQARFYRMMLNGGALDGKRVLSAKTVATMTQDHTVGLKCGFTPGMGQGYGFAVVRKPEGVTAMLSPGTFGHGGAFGTQAWADPKQDVFVVLLIQRTGLPNSDASDVRRELQRLAFAAVRR